MSDDGSGKIVDLDDQLPGLAAQANEYAEEAQIAAHSAVVAAWKSGMSLLATKKLLKHGEWLPWLAANFKYEPSTATRYMLIARNHARVQDLDPEKSLTATLNAIRGSKSEEDEPECGERAGLFDDDPPALMRGGLEQSSNDEEDAEVEVSRESGELWKPRGTMYGCDWLRILLNGELFASKDSTLPQYHAVHLEVDRKIHSVRFAHDDTERAGRNVRPMEVHQGERARDE